MTAVFVLRWVVSALIPVVKLVADNAVRLLQRGAPMIYGAVVLPWLPGAWRFVSSYWWMILGIAIASFVISQELQHASYYNGVRRAAQSRRTRGTRHDEENYEYVHAA